MEQKRITVKEVARLSGVSIGTVDRVLHGRDGVSSQTKLRIERTIASIGYEPNVLARQLSLNRKYRFRVIVPRAEQDSGYWGLCLKGIAKAARELAINQVTVDVDEFDRYDVSAYRALLEEVIRNPGDGLLIAPVLPDELRPALARLDPSLPYVFFDGAVEDTHPVTAIGQDPYAAGRLAGRMMSLLVGGRRPLLALNAHSEDRHIRRRVEGFISFFREALGELDDSAIIVGECREIEEPRAFLEAAFASPPAPAGILMTNASGHRIGEWLARTARKSACALVSWDLVPENERALREGNIDCIVSQRPAWQGEEGLERLFKAAARGEPEFSLSSVPIDIYLKENIPSSRGGE
jgi:LacI family transcriptional regulator